MSKSKLKTFHQKTQRGNKYLLFCRAAFFELTHHVMCVLIATKSPVDNYTHQMGSCWSYYLSVYNYGYSSELRKQTRWVTFLSILLSARNGHLRFVLASCKWTTAKKTKSPLVVHTLANISWFLAPKILHTFWEKCVHFCAPKTDQLGSPSPLGSTLNRNSTALLMSHWVIYHGFILSTICPAASWRDEGFLKKSTKAAFTTCSKLVFLLHHAKALHKRRFFWAILREFGNITVLCSIVFEQ